LTTRVLAWPNALPLRVRSAAFRRRAAFVAGIVALGAAYYAAAKVGQTLRYTASVAAIWPPAGVGIAALYLWGMRWWPGVLLGEIAVNVELLDSLPAGSLAGQQAGNMTQIVIGALLLRRICGPRAGLDRADQVAGMLAAVTAAAAISATFGMTSMLAGSVIEPSDAPRFWRTWWLGDTSGALLVVAAALAWSSPRGPAFVRLRSWHGAVMLSAVAVLGSVGVSVEDPVLYVVFPALIWAAFRFGPRGATLAIAITAALAIGITAADVGPFSKQAIDDRTVSTQLYIFVASLTTLVLAAVVSERARSAAALAAARLREGERAGEERRRIARDLHDSVSQALFSTVLHTRRAQRALDDPSVVAHSLGAIADLTRDAQSEMRTLIAELGRDPLAGGLVPALSKLAAETSERESVVVGLAAPLGEVGLPEPVQAHLFGIAREALANAVKHSGAGAVRMRVVAPAGFVVLEVTDGGHGFDAAATQAGHFGLESMRSRAAEIGGRLTIDSGEAGTVVRVTVPSDA
jgi:signal transduction histidine kinase